MVMTIKDKRLKLITEVFIEVLQNYIDKFTIYQIPFYLQLIHYNTQLRKSISQLTQTLILKIFENIITDLKSIDTLLELRNLSHLKICANLPQMLIQLISSNANFDKCHDKILSECYLTSIAYKEYSIESGIQHPKGNSILNDNQFMRFNRERMMRQKVNERKIFGG